MESKKFDIIGFENPFEDMVVEIDRLPPNNGKAYMRSMSFQGGGNVCTALAAASVLGAKCAIMGVIGDDLFARANRMDFDYHGIDMSHLRTEKGRRSNFSICISERDVNGKEFIINPSRYDEIRTEELDIPFLSDAKMLHVGGFVTPAMAAAADIVHKAGGKVSVDAAYYRPDIYENFHRLDIVIASETYYRAMCDALGAMTVEEAVRYIHDRGPEIAIITLGEKGCQGVCADQFFALPAFSVDVVDSTGAGDVFHGAYDYAYLQGWDAEACARFSSAVSAIKCTRMGGRAGIPDMAAVNHFLKTGEIDDSCINERAEHYQNTLWNE